MSTQVQVRLQVRLQARVQARVQAQVQARLQARLQAGLFAGLLWGLIAGGCATRPESAPPPDTADTSPTPAVSQPPVQPTVVILSEGPVDNRQLSYVLATRLGAPYRIFDLADHDPARVKLTLEQLAPQRAIVVGEAGLDVVRGLTGTDVIYAGVPGDYPEYRRVDALPPFRAQFSYWLGRNQKLKSVGVVASPGLGHLVEEMTQAASALGIDVHYRPARSDSETLAGFRMMVPFVDGFVFLPDQSILSPRVIRRAIAHGRRNGVEIAVYSPAMFAAGATHLFMVDSVDVATQLVAMVHSDAASRPLTRMRVQSQPDTVVAARD